MQADEAETVGNDTELERAIAAIFERDIAAIFERDAAFYEVIRKHGFRPPVFVGFDAPADARDATRKQADAAVLTAIRRSGQR
jgi:hypothetical protein